MDPVPDRDFETWFATPIPDESDHPALCVRRAHPSEFEQLYDLVDAAFAERRPRVLYDWLYRRSPLGPARCWTAVERKTGRFVNSVARIPWPFQLGDDPIEGSVQADSATAADWRGQNISALKKSRRRDPWQRRSVVVGWPNAKSQGAAHKHGRSHTLLGPLPRCVLPLRAGDLLRERGWPTPLADVAGAAADRALAWRRRAASNAPGVRLEEIHRFEAGFDPLTRRAMRHDGFWSPHTAEFLNWRYVDHPLNHHAAFAAYAGDTLQGWTLVQLLDERAVLMELAVPQDAAPGSAGALLARAARAAREAGCRQLEFFCTPQPIQRAALGRAGFLPAPSSVRIFARGGSDGAFEPRVFDLDAWRLVPGDRDAP